MNELKTLWKLYHYAQELKPKVIKASVYSITNKVFDLFPPLLIGLAVDTVVKGDQSFLSHYGAATQFDQLLIIAALTVVVWVLESFFEYLFAVEWRELAQAIQHKMRMNCYAHLQHLDHSFFEDQSSGNLISILGEDINQLERFLDVGMNELLQVITTVAVIGGIYFYHSPLLALFSFVTMPFIVWGSVWFQGFLAPLYRDVRDRAGLMTGELSNNLQGISTIKSFARESEDYTKMARFSRDYLEANQKAIKVSALFTPVIRMLVMVGFLVTLLFGGKLTLNGVIEVGTYSTMVFLIQRLLWPLTRLGQTLDLFQRAMASTNRALIS
jgi:ATP-binding cassette subfamily B protein